MSFDETFILRWVLVLGGVSLRGLILVGKTESVG